MAGRAVVERAAANARVTEIELVSTSEARTRLLPFDAARYLADDMAIAEYMTAVLEANDPICCSWRLVMLRDPGT